MKTNFLNPIEKGKIVTAATNGCEEATGALYNELDRLESRIRTLELYIENLTKTYNEARSKNIPESTIRYLLR